MSLGQQRYHLRKAAGCFFLIDYEQDGKDYRKPVLLNETGAQIWNLLIEKGSEEMAASELAIQYGMPPKELLLDVRQFVEMLKKQGILME